MSTLGNQRKAVEIKNLSMRFGNEVVLHSMNIAFGSGQIHGIVGRNGSGKTVLFKCICGFLRPSSGSVAVFNSVIGKDLDFAPSTGMLIEAPGFLLNETGYNNLRWLARIGAGASRERIHEVLRMTGLDPRLKKKVSAYSLGIAQAFLENPDLLILDEPMNGLDNKGVHEVRELLLKTRAAGKTILLASHNPLDIEALCDTVHEMDAGYIYRRE